LLDSLKPYVKGVRTYGTQNGLEKIPLLAKQRGLNVMVGIFLSEDTLVNNAQIAKAIELSNAGYADKLIVGGEALYNNLLTPVQLITYINRVKAACPGIPVTTAEVYSTLLAHPEVAAACDFIFPNMYPYYEGQPIECAMQWFDQTYQSLLTIAGGKEIIISETGWKTAGPAVGDAMPSFHNAIRFHRELLAWSLTTGVEVTIFEAFDEPWKLLVNDDGWGLFFSNATLKPGMDSVFMSVEPVVPTWLCDEPVPVGSDTLALDYIPVIGSSDNVKGHVNFINTCDYSIATYIKVGGAWWTKPTFGMPTVPVLCNGRWNVDYTAGGNDPLATDMCFFLVPEVYTPPQCSGCTNIPQQAYTNSIADLCIQRYVLNNVSIFATDSTICNGDSTLLTASGGNQYIWSTGETTASIYAHPTTNTTYSVTITDGLGGGAIVSKMIKVLPKPNFALTATPDTIDTGGMASLQVTGAGSISFFWSTGETTRTIEVHPLTTTTYTVTATGGNGCIAIDTITVVVNPISSATELSHIKSVSVYPKPVHGILHVEIELLDSKKISLRLLNEMGSVSAQKRVLPVNGLVHTQFDMTSIPPGLYFLLIRTSQGETLTEKIPVY
jgi:exo-beta-1,3-glucanase (GH17 family)